MVFGASYPPIATNQQLSSAASYTWQGGSELAQAGTAIESLGDLDQDGDDDYILTAPGEGDGGVAYIIPGFFSAGGNFDLENPAISAVSPNAQDIVRIQGSSGDSLSRIAFNGDYNGDSHTDLLIGAPNNSSNALNGGAVYIMYMGGEAWSGWWDSSNGASLGTIVLEDEVNDYNFVSRLASSVENEGFGNRINGLGSVNGDSYDDFGVGTTEKPPKFYIFNGGGI